MDMRSCFTIISSLLRVDLRKTVITIWIIELASNLCKEHGNSLKIFTGCSALIWST